MGSVGRIRRSWLGLLGAAGLVAVTGVIAPAVAAPATNVIVLPGATSAEGIAVGRGSTFYAGDLFGGDIFRGDLQRGTVELFIDTPPGQMSVGLKVDGVRIAVRCWRLQWSGLRVRRPHRCRRRDVPVRSARPVDHQRCGGHRAGAWFTDSMQARLYFVPIGPAGGARSDGHRSRPVASSTSTASPPHRTDALLSSRIRHRGALHGRPGDRSEHNRASIPGPTSSMGPEAVGGATLPEPGVHG